VKSVISASRRTDIPAFYLDWFMDAICRGHILVQNPLYPVQYRSVNLDPAHVGWIVFWSRNYATFLKNYTFFEDYQLFFHFTILSSCRLFESYHLSLKSVIIQIGEIAKLYGPEKIIWRYDPIIIWEKKGIVQTNFNPREYTAICRELSQMKVDKCYFSFVTPYRKVLRRLSALDPDIKLLHHGTEKALTILNEMKDITAKWKIQLFSCSNDQIVGEGIRRGSCISGEYLNKLSGTRVVSTAKAPGRKDCGCTLSIDIGSYTGHPCRYGCLYCYANPVTGIKSRDI